MSRITINIYRLLFFQCAILVISYVNCSPQNLPPRLLSNHKYELDSRLSWIQEANLRIDEICFMKDMVWYSLFSYSNDIKVYREYFLAWEVKFLQMTSARVIFRIAGIKNEPEWLVSCKFKNPNEIRDFHREIYLDRVPIYSTDPHDRLERIAIWQGLVHESKTEGVEWPEVLTKLYDIKALAKIQTNGEEADVDIMATSNDDVILYYENHKIEGNVSKIFTVISNTWIEEERQTVPLALVIFGKNNFAIVGYIIQNRLVIKVLSDYYVISLANNEQAGEVYEYLEEYADKSENDIELPSEVEEHVWQLE